MLCYTRLTSMTWLILKGFGAESLPSEIDDHAYILMFHTTKIDQH